MVLYKRKAIKLDTPKEDDSLLDAPNRQVWLIKETSEIYVNYEDFLHRLSFYQEPSFTCEVSGKTGLTYREAWASEVEEAKGIDEIFPEALKEPILRKVHASLIPRLDGLVDLIFDSFKSEYFPGEYVVASIDGYRQEALVREKTKLVEMTFPDGFHRPASARYVIELTADYDDSTTERRVTVDESVLSRERGVLTKVMLRSYLRNHIRREPKVGAPWKVKADVAQRYRIETLEDDIPASPSSKKKANGVAQTNGTTLAEEDSLAAKTLVEDLNLTSRHLKRPRMVRDFAVSPHLAQYFLEVWAFFNVFLEVLTLDSFTLDDFGDALQSKERSELVDELFCSILRTLSTERSKPRATTTTEDQHLSNGDHRSEDGLRNGEADSRTQTLLQVIPDWKANFLKQEFEDDGYITILLGLATEVSDGPSKANVKDFIDAFLLDGPPTSDALPGIFRSLSANVKLQVLMAIIDLVWQTNLVRQYIDECMENLTQLRKDRADATRDRKILTDSIYQLRLKMRAQFPRSGTVGATVAREGQLKQAAHEDANSLRNDSSDAEMDVDIPEDDSVTDTRTSSRRRISSRLVKRALPDVDTESNDDASLHEDSATKVYRSRDDYEWEIQKVQKSVVKADLRIQRIDEEFRESDAQRLRKLGCDRFWNTYWWLESCGMPVYGLPNCSTSHAQFATGRIFVQGPTECALAELRERSKLHEYDYHKRRIAEEGEDVLEPDTWGYYEDAEHLEELLEWLDARGTRESKLKAAIEQRIDTIERTMEHRGRYLSGEALNERRSTRNTEGEVPRFQKWKNTMARKTLGAPHCGEVRVKGIASKKRKR